MKITASRTIELHGMSVRTEIAVEDCELPTHSVTLAAMLEFLRKSEAQNAVTAHPFIDLNAKDPTLQGFRDAVKTS